MGKPSDYSPLDIAELYQNNGQSERAVSRITGISRGAVKYRLDQAARLGVTIDKPISGGTPSMQPPVVRPLPREGEIKRYICTAVQNNTDCFTPWFENLVAYAEHIGAELLCATFSYNRSSYGSKATKRDLGPTADDRKENWYDPIFHDFYADYAIELAPMLVWRGEMNTMPTADRPLSGMQTYGGRQSSIFPHAKIAMESVAGTKSDGAKFLYTTGASTMLNYIKKKTGLKAEFHHAYGACIVEVDHEGDWFVRQLNGDKDGSFYDIPDLGQLGAVYVEAGHVMTEGEAVEAVNWGDAHVEVMDPEQKEIAFGEGGILDSLQPRHQLVHDVLDFTVNKGHHDRRSSITRYRKKVKGQTNVEQEVISVGEFLDYIRRDYCQTVIADANHDRHLERWLDETDFRHDDTNAVYYLEENLAYRKAMDDDCEQEYLFLQRSLERLGYGEDDIWLGIDDPWILCADEDGEGGIDCSLHGDIGPNGSRGTPLALARMGRRANTGHTHSACIIEGLYVAGTLALLSQDWNKGPSSWSHSHIVTYPNGKRAIITCYNGKWRAGS